MIERLTAICLGGSLCLAIALPLELRSHVTESAVTMAIAKTVESPAVRNNATAIKQLVATSLARPLFSATRRPPENEQDDHPDTLLKDLRLTGIMVMPGQQLAIFVGSNGKPLVRSEGEMISDWRIDTIAAQSISLSGPGGTTTLEPKADPNLVRLQAATQPTATPPPPAANSPPPPAKAPVRPTPVLRSER